jgi:hypothetical protein
VWFLDGSEINTIKGILILIVLELSQPEYCPVSVIILQETEKVLLSDVFSFPDKSIEINVSTSG